MWTHIGNATICRQPTKPTRRQLSLRLAKTSDLKFAVNNCYNCDLQ